MADLTTLIEDIRATLAHPNLASPEEMPIYAQQYAEECTKLNDRLKRCLPHLRSGNIAEAVRLASTPPPDITETFNLLDFAERQDWIEVCTALELSLPPVLSVGMFQELNDAYFQMSSLEPLLKWHRLYARNGSPLRDRLGVLRSIAKADPMTTHWQTDQEMYERARIKELAQEVNEALAQKDILLLLRLYRELTTPGWKIAPPTEYKQKIVTAILEKYAEELHMHFSTFDYDEASAAFQSIQRVLKANQMAMPTAIEKKIQPAVQWVKDTTNEKRDIDHFQRALYDLQEALNDNVPRQTLEDIYYTLQDAASQSYQTIPKELKSRYRSRVKDMLGREYYRKGITIAAIVSAFILISALFMYMFLR